MLNGLQGEIQVEGQTFNGVMPPNGFLTDEQVAQLLTYLRQNFGNFAGGVKPADVAEVRRDASGHALISRRTSPCAFPPRRRGPDR